MNIFSVLGLNYELFHTRMLQWLWTTDADHGAGDTFLCAFLTDLGIAHESTCRIDAEVKIGATRGAQWRLADLVVRTGRSLILVENKVDPAYQDVDQILDEIEGGRAIAEAEGLEFTFVLIAPGPLSPAVRAALDSNGGQYISWTRAIELLRGVTLDGIDPIVAAVVQQYFAFCDRRQPEAPTRPATDEIVQESTAGLHEIVRDRTATDLVTAEQLWPEFLSRFPDHVSALNDRWAESSNYSTKVWFASALSRMAKDRDLIEDTGEWQRARPDWGYSKVRVYRRLSNP